MRVLLAAMIIPYMWWTCSALWRVCRICCHSLSRLIWWRICQPHTVIFVSASTMNTLYMISTSCSSPSMTGIREILYSTRSPRIWMIYTHTGVRRILEGLQMARRRFWVDTRTWSRGYSVYPIPGSWDYDVMPTSSTWVFSSYTLPSLTRFYSVFTSIVLYLFWQQKIFWDKPSQCPLICNTHWLTVIKLTTWFDNHLLVVSMYLKVKKPYCIPDNS